jgi:hypothetical protein
MSDIHASPPLPNDVALRVAVFFGVPDKERHSFCDLLSGTVQRVRSRARPEEPSPALVRAADAARILNEALASLNNEDREWIEELLAEHPEYSDVEAADAVASLRERASWLVGLFSVAIGKSPGGGVRPTQRGRRPGTVENVIFQEFVFDLLSTAGASGGHVTFDKNYETGTLVDAIKVLTPHLPKDVVPKNLSKSMGTIQRIVTKYRKLLPDIEPDKTK